MLRPVIQTLNHLFEWKAEEADHRCDKHVIEHLKDNERAIKNALNALKVADKYVYDMSFKDRQIFKHCYSEFLKEK